jgi:hypothetical protein
MARDYTKYSVTHGDQIIGENLNKRKFIFETVRHYIQCNNPTSDELKTTFPDSLQGSKGMIRLTSEEYNANRFSTQHIDLDNGISCVVSNQWSKENTANFVNKVQELGYVVDLSSVEQPLVTKEETSNEASIIVRVQTDDRDEIATCHMDWSDCSKNLEDEYSDYLSNPSARGLEGMVNSLTMDDNFVGSIMSQMILGNFESGDKEHIEAMMSDNYDWYEYIPHMVITKLGELDLDLIYDVADDWEQPEEVVEKVCSYLACSEDSYDEAAEDYVGMVRMSIISSDFMDLADQLT